MKGNKVAQYKIKPLASWQTLWEDTAYLGMLRLDTQEEADRVAEALSDIFVAEVRWNWLDSTQGHYVISAYTLNAYLKERKMKEQNENLVD